MVAGRVLLKYTPSTVERVGAVNTLFLQFRLTLLKKGMVKSTLDQRGPMVSTSGPRPL